MPAIPWQVYTLAEFKDRAPAAIALGDLNFDGRVELMVSADGALAFFDSQTVASIFNQWAENLIVDDGSGESIIETDPNLNAEAVTGGTVINSILVVDLDGDGANDIVATLDRTGLSGLSNDALAWFRNTRRPPR